MGVLGMKEAWRKRGEGGGEKVDCTTVEGGIGLMIDR